MLTDQEFLAKYLSESEAAGEELTDADLKEALVYYQKTKAPAQPTFGQRALEGTGKAISVIPSAVGKGLAQTAQRGLSSVAGAIEGMTPTLATQPMVPRMREDFSGDVAPGVIPQQRPFMPQEQQKITAGAQRSAEAVREFEPVKIAIEHYDQDILKKAAGSNAAKLTADIVSSAVNNMATMTLAGATGPAAPFAMGAAYGTSSADEFVQTARNEMSPALIDAYIASGMSKDQATTAANEFVRKAVADKAFYNGMLQGTLDAASAYVFLNAFPGLGRGILKQTPALAAKLTGALGRLKIAKPFQEFIKQGLSFAFQGGQEEIQNIGQRKLEIRAGIKGSGLSPMEEASSQRAATWGSVGLLQLFGLAGNIAFNAETKRLAGEAEKNPTPENLEKAEKAVTGDWALMPDDSKQAFLQSLTPEQKKVFEASIAAEQERSAELAAENVQVKAELTESDKKARQSEIKAKTADLTGLPERRAFKEGFTTEDGRVLKPYKEMLDEGWTIVRMDGDKTKEYNDKFSHNFTDQNVLIPAKTTVDKVARTEGAIVYDPKGDEIIMAVPPGVDAKALTERAIAEVNKVDVVRPDGQVDKLSVTAGVGLPGGLEDVADAAANLAKARKIKIATAEEWNSLPASEQERVRELRKGRQPEVPTQVHNVLQNELLNRAGIPAADIPDLVMSSLADGAVLREITARFNKGEIKLTDAVNEVKKQYERFQEGEITPEGEATPPAAPEPAPQPPVAPEVKPVKARVEVKPTGDDLKLFESLVEANRHKKVLPGGLIRDADDRVINRFGATSEYSPDWRAMFGRDGSVKGIGKDEVIRIYEKVKAGETLTERQATAYEQIMETLKDHEQRNPEIAIADDLNIGDTFMKEGEKHTVKAITEDGKVKIQNGTTEYLHPGETIEIDRGTLEKTTTKETKENKIDAIYDAIKSDLKQGKSVIIPNAYGGINLKGNPDGFIRTKDGIAFKRGKTLTHILPATMDSWAKIKNLPPVTEPMPDINFADFTTDENGEIVKRADLKPTTEKTPAGDQAVMSGLAGREMPRGPIKQKPSAKSDRGTIFDQEGLKTDREVQAERGQGEIGAKTFDAIMSNAKEKQTINDTVRKLGPEKAFEKLRQDGYNITLDEMRRLGPQVMGGATPRREAYAIINDAIAKNLDQDKSIKAAAEEANAGIGTKQTEGQLKDITDKWIKSSGREMNAEVADMMTAIKVNPEFIKDFVSKNKPDDFNQADLTLHHNETEQMLSEHNLTASDLNKIGKDGTEWLLKSAKLTEITNRTAIAAKELMARSLDKSLPDGERASYEAQAHQMMTAVWNLAQKDVLTARQIGRALEYRKQGKNVDAKNIINTINDAMKEPGVNLTKAQTQELFRKVANLEPGQPLLTAVKKTTFGDWFWHWYYSSILSGPRTHFKNIGDTFANGIAEQLTNIIIDPANAANVIKEYSKAAGKGLGTAIVETGRAFESPIRSMMGRPDRQRTEAMAEVHQKFEQDRPLGPTGNAAWKIMAIPGRIMSAWDLGNQMPTKAAAVSSITKGRMPTEFELIQAAHESRRAAYNNEPEGWVGEIATHVGQ